MLPDRFRSREEWSFPNIVNVCVIRGSCNASCRHCPVGLLPQDKRKERFGDENISDALFKKIVDEISGFRHSTLRIHGVGEPTLWKGLAEGLKYANKKKVRTWLFTNGIINNRRILEALLSASIVEFSVNSINNDDYIQTKGVDAFWLVKKNIANLHDKISTNGYATRLIASRVQSTAQSDKEFESYWKRSGLVADAFVRTYHDYNGLISDKEDSSKDIVPCLVHWTRFNIDSSGRAVVCFNELFKAGSKVFTLGDINISKIADIWHGRELSMIRRAQLKKSYENLDFKDKLPCADCFYCQPLDTKNITSEHQIKQLVK